MSIAVKTRILLACITALAGTAVGSAFAQNKFTTDMRIEPGSIPAESDDWRAAFSVDQAPDKDPAPAIIDLAGATSLTVTYKGKLAGLNIGRIFITADLTDSAYQMTYKVETQGLARWLDQTEQEVLSYGLLAGNEMTALYYLKNETEPDSTQSVEMTRKGPGERFRLWSDPEYKLYHPVMPEISLDTVDPLAALALLGFIEAEAGEDPCNRVIPVFDGRKRFNMRMVPAGTRTLKNRSKNRYEGFTYKCEVFMDKIAGYNQKNMDRDFNGRAYVHLAPLPEEIQTPNFTYLPVLIEARSGMVSGSLEAKAPIITLANGTVIDMGRK